MVDLVIIALILAAAAWGYRRGVMTKPLVLFGFAGGTLLGLWVARPVLEAVLPDPYGQLLGVPAALVCGVLLAGALERVAIALRRRLGGRRRLEAIWGAGLAALLGLVTIWIVAALVTRVDSLRDPVADSELVAGLNAVVPPGRLAEDAGSGSRELQSPSRVNVKLDPQVRAAKASVLKITVAVCGSGGSGSGWIADDGIVVTNAHVVAAANDIRVQLEGTGEPHRAEAIWFDKVNDIAILRSDGVRGERPLPIDPTPKRGAPLAMLGFPGGGPYKVSRAQLGITAEIPGLFVGDDKIKRKVSRLITNGRPGNSGGPVVDLKGRVAGVLFASDLGSTSYAVVTSTVLRALRRAEGPVDTGDCKDHEGMTDHEGMPGR